MDIFIGYVLKGIVLPPGGIVFLALIGWCLAGRSRRAANALVMLAFAALWIGSTPVIAAWVARDLEHTTAALDAASPAARAAEAIVVLGGGRYRAAPEYGGDTLDRNSLERIRYAAHLYRRTATPLAVTGGVVIAGTEPEAVLMRATLEGEFSVPVRWAETASRNTAENAFNTRALIGVDRIILVTHAMHMRRAAGAFRAAGFQVLPAPMGFATGSTIDYGLFDWLPSMSALATTTAALHEYLGMAWYRLRYGVDAG